MSKPQNLTYKLHFPEIFNPKVSVHYFRINGKNISEEYLKQKKSLSSTFEVNLPAEECLKFNNPDDPDHFQVSYQAEVALGKIGKMPKSSFGAFEQVKNLLKEYAKNSNCEDIEIEKSKILDKVSENLLTEVQTPYEYAVEAYKYASESMDYDYNEHNFSIDKAQKSRKGDCDDFTNVFIQLLRRADIPAIQTTVWYQSFGDQGGHAIPFFILPLADGSPYWIGADPTFACVPGIEKEKFFQYYPREYFLYAIQTLIFDFADRNYFFISCDKTLPDVDFDGLNNAIENQFDRRTSKFLNSVKTTLDYESVHDLNLMIDQLNWGERKCDVFISSREGLKVYYGHSDRRHSHKKLTSPLDEEVISRMKSAYTEINQHPSGIGFVAFWDSSSPFSDRSGCTIEIDPILFQKFGPEIIDTLEKYQFIRPEMSKTMHRLYEASGGKFIHDFYSEALSKLNQIN